MGPGTAAQDGGAQAFTTDAHSASYTLTSIRLGGEFNATDHGGTVTYCNAFRACPTRSVLMSSRIST